MIKDGLAKPGRTPCEVCGQPSVKGGDRPLCEAHAETPTVKSSSQQCLRFRESPDALADLHRPR